MADVQQPSPCRLYVIAALLSRAEANGSTSVRLVSPYRGARDGEDAVLGRFVREICTENPGFSVSGAASVQEIPRADLEKVLAAADELQARPG
jgi:hypothetical protein